MRSWRGWSWDDGNFGGSGLEPQIGALSASSCRFFRPERFWRVRRGLCRAPLSSPAGGRHDLPEGEPPHSGGGTPQGCPGEAASARTFQFSTAPPALKIFKLRRQLKARARYRFRKPLRHNALRGGRAGKSTKFGAGESTIRVQVKARSHPQMAQVNARANPQRSPLEARSQMQVKVRALRGGTCQPDRFPVFREWAFSWASSEACGLPASMSLASAMRPLGPLA